MLTIKNKQQLINNGRVQLAKKARALAINSLESALTAVDPNKLIKSKLSIKKSILYVNGLSFDLKKVKNIFVIGGGKASGSMAEVLEQLLGKRITNGSVNVPYGSKNKTEIIHLHEASHPIPDENSVNETCRMLEIVKNVHINDLVICLISGGGSSLMTLPRAKISILDIQKITKDLLKCGATVKEINTVRKHISEFKGGQLAERLYPATILNLVLSDVVGDPLASIASGPTVPDFTTFSDSIMVLKKHGLWTKAPLSIKAVLLDGKNALIPETPKADSLIFKKVFNVILGNNKCASLAAYNFLKSAGLNTLLLTSVLEGESKHVGTVLASIAHEFSLYDNSVQKPAGIVVGGETTVTVTGKGIGGRNQEMVLAAALKLKGLKNVVVASLNTDGIDGPTNAAGAIADGYTLERSKERGCIPEVFLAENNSYKYFLKLDDLIFTGITGTNVNDVSVLVIL